MKQIDEKCQQIFELFQEGKGKIAIERIEALIEKSYEGIDFKDEKPCYKKMRDFIYNYRDNDGRNFLHALVESKKIRDNPWACLYLINKGLALEEDCAGFSLLDEDESGELLEVILNRFREIFELTLLPNKEFKKLLKIDKIRNLVVEETREKIYGFYVEEKIEENFGGNVEFWEGSKFVLDFLFPIEK